MGWQGLSEHMDSGRVLIGVKEFLELANQQWPLTQVGELNDPRHFVMFGSDGRIFVQINHVGNFTVNDSEFLDPAKIISDIRSYIEG